MVVVSRTIQAFSFDGATKQHVRIEAGTKVNVLKQAGSDVVCSIGIPNFQIYAIIPADALRVKAKTEEEKATEEKAEEEKLEVEQAEKERQAELGVREELPREEIEEPEVWETEADVEELQEVALHKRHLTTSEFDDFLSDKVSALDSPLARRLKRKVQKQFPDIAEDELQQKMKGLYEQHADTVFLRGIRRGIEVEKRGEEIGEAPKLTKPKRVPGKPEVFEIHPEVRRRIPKIMKEKYGYRPMGTLPIPGHEGRFRVEQVDPYSSIIALRDIKTRFYDLLGGPELAYQKAIQIVNNERDIEDNPMPINTKSGMGEIIHEGYVIQRQFDKDKHELNYVFFHPRRRTQVRQAGATLKEAKDAVDTYILERAGVKEPALAG